MILSLIVFVLDKHILSGEIGTVLFIINHFYGENTAVK